MDNISISQCPARVTKPAWTVFHVFDKDGNLVAHNDAARPEEKDCLLNLDNAQAPFTVKFTAVEAPKSAAPADIDEFPAGV